MKLRFSWKWFEIGIIVLVLLLHLYVALSPADSLMHWYRNDDAFYYFKVAANFTSGHGLAFDGIDRSNGFQPLWELVCIAVFWTARYSLTLPLRLLVIVSALLNAGTAIFIFRILRRFIRPETAAIPAILWLCLPFIHVTVVQNGLEAGLSVFFVAFLLYLAVTWQKESLTPGRLLLLGVVAGLTILARLDNIFVVALLGVWFALGSTPVYLRTVVTGDLAIIFIVGLLSYFAGFRSGRTDLATSASLPWLVGLEFILQPALFFFFRLYTPTGEAATWKFLARMVLAAAAAAAAIGLILAFLHRLGILASLPVFVLLVDFIAGTVCFLGLRLGARLLFGKEAIASPQPVFSWKFWQLPFNRALGYFLPPGVLMGAYMAGNRLYFGTPMPVSGLVKYWWGSLYLSLYGSVQTRDLSVVFGNDAWTLALTPLRSVTNFIQAIHPIAFLPGLVKLVALAILLGVLFSQRKWVVGPLEQLGLLAVFAGLYAQILSYTSTSYWDTSEWYWASETLFTILFLGVLLECVYRMIQRFKRSEKLWRGLVVVAGAGGLVYLGVMLWQNFPYAISPEQQQAYLTEEHWLEANTDPGALIGMKGGGVVGYFIQDRTVVNLDGLINSYPYFQSIRDGRGAQFLSNLGLDYVVGTDLILATSPYRETLTGRLAAASNGNGETLYRYVPSP